jgi:hypothetical protein
MVWHVYNDEYVSIAEGKVNGIDLPTCCFRSRLYSPDTFGTAAFKQTFRAFSSVVTLD